MNIEIQNNYGIWFIFDLLSSSNSNPLESIHKTKLFLEISVEHFILFFFFCIYINAYKLNANVSWLQYNFRWLIHTDDKNSTQAQLHKNQYK